MGKDRSEKSKNEKKQENPPPKIQSKAYVKNIQADLQATTQLVSIANFDG